jgi:ADP-ribosylglycohydrolase
VAAIVGALAGALHGREAIPERWLAGLTGWTSYADDGRVCQVLTETRRRWFDANG